MWHCAPNLSTATIRCPSWRKSSSSDASETGHSILSCATNSRTTHRFPSACTSRRRISAAASVITRLALRNLSIGSHLSAILSSLSSLCCTSSLSSFSLSRRRSFLSWRFHCRSFRSIPSNNSLVWREDSRLLAITSRVRAELAVCSCQNIHLEQGEAERQAGSGEGVGGGAVQVDEVRSRSARTAARGQRGVERACSAVGVGGGEGWLGLLWSLGEEDRVRLRGLESS